MIGADIEGIVRQRPIRFRHSFHLNGAPASATLLATACGVYRAFLNGQPVGDHVLAPGWTSYHHRHFVQSFDIADQLIEGENVLGIEVAEGWYRGRLGWGAGVVDTYGKDLGAFAELTLSGSEADAVVVTDATWVAAPSATLTASLYDGETFDQRSMTTGRHRVSTRPCGLRPGPSSSTPLRC